MKVKLIALASWIGLLISAVSEYGFDVDFPLTPPLWLVIAVSALLFVAAHSAIGSRIHSIGKRETGTYLSGTVPPLSDFAISISDGHTSPRVSDRPPSLARDNSSISGAYRGQMSAGGVIITASDAIPAVIFLSPAATRGPPWSDAQIDRTLGRPARHSYAAPLPSEIHFHDSSVARNAFPNGTNQTPIRSAIEGDQT